jgi:hypothetical protein
MRWRCKTGGVSSIDEYPTMFLFPGSHLIIETFSNSLQREANLLLCS